MHAGDSHNLRFGRDSGRNRFAARLGTLMDTCKTKIKVFNPNLLRRLVTPTLTIKIWRRLQVRYHRAIMFS